MVSRSSPELKSGASRPSFINPLHWESMKTVTSRHQCFGRLAPGTTRRAQTSDGILHEHEVDRDVYLLRRSRFAKCSGPACTAVVAVLVLPRVMVHAMQHGSPAQPALSIQVDASHAVRSARRRAPEVESPSAVPFLLHSIKIW